MNFFKPNFWDKNRISFFSICLLPFSWLIKLFNLFKYLFTQNYKHSIPIICVGNIYLGGTGKTPLCIEIFSILKSLNMKPAFIRKKYENYQDEVNLLKQSGAVYQNKKRINALNEAIQNKINVAILDDGFQDFSVNKNLSIVCFNEKQWIGNGFVIPAGPLREDLSALKRAHCVVIKGKKNNNIEEKILNKNSKIKIFYTNYKAQNIDNFKSKKVIAFAGIGNPENFFNLLKDNNINILKEKKFPDHHNYSENELQNLIDESRDNNAILVTTEKDYFRINNDKKQNMNYLKVKISIENKNQFIDLIKKII